MAFLKDSDMWPIKLDKCFVLQYSNQLGNYLLYGSPSVKIPYGQRSSELIVLKSFGNHSLPHAVYIRKGKLLYDDSPHVVFNSFGR